MTFMVDVDRNYSFIRLKLYGGLHRRRIFGSQSSTSVCPIAMMAAAGSLCSPTQNVHGAYIQFHFF